MKHHKITLDCSENMLVVKEPDERVWVFFFLHLDDRPMGLAVFSNSQIPTATRSSKKWQEELSATLKLQLQGSVPSIWLDGNWDKAVFPQIEKIVVEFNKGRRKADGA